jgi:hypothetical protein
MGFNSSFKGLIVSIFLFQNYNNMEFGIVRLIGIFVVGKLALTVGLIILLIQ